MIVVVLLPLAWGKLQAIFGRAGVPLTKDLIVGLSLVLIFLAVSVAYYFLPNLKQHIRCVAPGAALVTFLWIAAAQLLSLYIMRFGQLNRIYGSLGSLIATLLFFYVSNIIFIYGAELNYLLKTAMGPKIKQAQPAAKS